MVSMVLSYSGGIVTMYISISIQVLIVAGGWDDGYTPLSSTEKMTTGATAWTTIKPLPRTLYGMASVSLDNMIILTGKCGSVVVW